MYNFLLEKGADIHVRDPHGYSTLHVAAEKGDLETVKDLVNRGV
jgi:ankyrin repeat protein